LPDNESGFVFPVVEIKVSYAELPRVLAATPCRALGFVGRYEMKQASFGELATTNIVSTSSASASSETSTVERFSPHIIHIGPQMISSWKSRLWTL